jgi:hypothetical protein
VREPQDCEDELERTLLRSIARVGYAICNEPEEPPYAYTVGLQHRFGHPELVVVGLAREQAQALLKLASEAVAAGGSWTDTVAAGTLLEGYPCRFGPVSPVNHKSYLGYTRWFYRGDGFAARQLIWPDRDGNFAENGSGRQPLLG